MKNNKAPGYDGITGELIKVIYKMDKQLFINILNRIWRSNKFPDL